jgi:hypothetical protein
MKRITLILSIVAAIGVSVPTAQAESSYTTVSNIMKTKHDTVKNSISNVR